MVVFGIPKPVFFTCELGLYAERRLAQGIGICHGANDRPDLPPPMFPSGMHFSQRPHEVEQRDLQISTAGISFADHVLMVNGQRSGVNG